MGTQQLVIINSLVKCRRLKPASFVTLQDCQKCELHGGVIPVMKAEGMPPVEDVLCKLPTKIRIEFQVRGVE